MEFEQQFCGCFFGDPEEDRLLEKFAIEYYESTERHDFVFCSGRSKDGVAIPADSFERHESNCFALKKMREIQDELKMRGIDPGKLRGAMERVIRLNLWTHESAGIWYETNIRRATENTSCG